MTKEFRNYVDKILENNGIGENEEFGTSDPRFSILKWSCGTMYEKNGNRLTKMEIVWVLEETDIAIFKKVPFRKALSILNWNMNLNAENEYMRKPLYLSYKEKGYHKVLTIIYNTGTMKIKIKSNDGNSLAVMTLDQIAADETMDFYEKVSG